MNARIGTMIGAVLCLNMALPAMVVQSHCEDKDQSIRTESGVFNEDYLFLGHELNFSGEAEDLVFLGKQLNFDGKTKLGLIAICEKLAYSGTSGNGIIAGGMDMIINGAINGTSYVGCKSLTLTDSATVNGNLFVGCGRLAIDGRLNGDIYAGSGEITINNEIRGNVIAYGGRLVIGKQGKIVGNLTYGTKEKLTPEEQSRVTGSVTVDTRHAGGDKDAADFSKALKTIGKIICFALFVSCTIIGLLILFIPAFGKLETNRSDATFWNTALWGLIPMLMYPAVIVLCVALIIPIPLAVMLVLACVPLFFLANIIGTMLAGRYLVTKLNWRVQKRHYHFLIGSAVALVLSWIPIVNCLTFILLTALGWGVYVSFLFKKDLTVVPPVAASAAQE
jgi:hypothetical protein